MNQSLGWGEVGAHWHLWRESSPCPTGTGSRSTLDSQLAGPAPRSSGRLLAGTCLGWGMTLPAAQAQTDRKGTQAEGPTLDYRVGNIKSYTSVHE